MSGDLRGSAEGIDTLHSDDGTSGRALVARLFTAMADRNCDAAIACFSADALIEVAFDPLGRTQLSDMRRFQGEAQVRDFIVTLTAQVRQCIFHIEDISATNAGSRLFVEARGDLIMADGTPYTNRYIFRFDIADDKIIHQREYYNVVTAIAAFGSW